MGREGVTGLGLSPKKYHFLSFQGDCGHLDREHHPCRAHGDPLQSVCTYQQIISSIWARTRLIHSSRTSTMILIIVIIILGRQSWLWKLSGFLQPPRTRLVPGEIKNTKWWVVESLQTFTMYALSPPSSITISSVGKRFSNNIAT